MRVIICGGRHYDDRERVHTVIAALAQDVTIVSGGATGADALAEQNAVFLGKLAETHYPNWQLHGKIAGFIRNQEMLDSGCDLVIAFPGGNGTADMVNRAKQAGVPVLEVS